MTLKPRILIICSSSLVVNQHLIEIIGLLRVNYNIDLATNYSYESSLDLLLSTCPVKLHSIPFQRKPAFIPDILSIFSLFNLLLKSDYQLLFSFTPKAGLITSLTLFIRRFFFFKKLQYIHYFTGNLWRHRSKLSLSRFLLRTIDQFIISVSKFSLFDSHTQVSIYKNTCLVDIRKLFCLGSGSLKGVDTSIFTPNGIHRDIYRFKFKIPKKSFVLLYLGRINPSKGLSTLLSVFNDLKEKYSDLYLLIVGPDDGYILPYFPPESRILRFDFTAHPERFYNIADLHILPSEREGFGSSVIEAAACGVPTIGSSIEGLSESIIHLKTGLLYDRQFPLQLYNSIEYLYLHREHLSVMSTNAQNYVTNQFKQDCVLQHLQEFLANNV